MTGTIYIFQYTARHKQDRIKENEDRPEVYNRYKILYPYR